MTNRAYDWQIEAMAAERAERRAAMRKYKGRHVRASWLVVLVRKVVAR